MSGITGLDGQGLFMLNPAGPVVSMMPTQDPATNAPGTNQNWCTGLFHNLAGPATDQWTAGNLGQVFGIALDNAGSPNIYVAASTGYGSVDLGYASSGNGVVQPFGTSETGPSGPGAVYRLDGTTGAISTFALLPMGTSSLGNGAGPALGNICFDETSNRFYVSNFDDGRIYCLSATGAVIGTLTNVSGPGTIAAGPIITPDPLVDGRFHPLGERPWAVKTHNGRLYYSIWVEDAGRLNTARANEIWSIATGGVSGFSGSAQLEFSVSPMPDPIFTNVLFPFPGQGSNPVSDISFDSTGRMMIAERVMWSDVGIGSTLAAQNGHAARNLEYQLVGSAWTPTLSPARSFGIGGVVYTGANAAGGNDFACDDALFSTGDALLQGNGIVYGVQITPPGGNAPNTNASITGTGYFVDLNDVYTTADKNRTGDVVVRRDCCRCAILNDVRVECNLTNGVFNGSYTYTFTFTNNTSPPQPIQYLIFGQNSGITPGSIALPSPVPPGNTSGPITVTVTPPAGATRHCFSVTFANPEIEDCCVVEHCIDLPDCDCFIFRECFVTCNPLGQPVLNFNVQNTGPNPFNEMHIFAQPPGSPVTFTPADFFFPNVNPGNFSPLFQTVVGGAAPGTQVCARFSVHLNGEVCCSVLKCFTVPPCANGSDCDDVDFNGDGVYPDVLDLDDFLSVFAGGPCSNDPNCGDIDFNNDGVSPDVEDINDFLSVLGGGPC
jgi:hypothetical protein